MAEATPWASARGKVRAKETAWARLWNDGTDETIEQWVDAFYGTKEAWVSDLKRVLHE